MNALYLLIYNENEKNNSFELDFFIATTKCTGPGGFFDDDPSSEEEVFVFDLTIDDMWNDIPVNQTSASDVLNLTYELGKSPRVTNLTEIGYSMNGQPLLLVEFGDYDPECSYCLFCSCPAC